MTRHYHNTKKNPVVGVLMTMSTFLGYWWCCSSRHSVTAASAFQYASSMTRRQTRQNAWMLGTRAAALATTQPQRFMVASSKQDEYILQDDSAASRSRAPFSMPKNSADDAVSASQQEGSVAWTKLGLLNELGDLLAQELKLSKPTPVQQLVIPALLQAPTNGGLAFLAATGSGKTLTYLLPLLQNLKAQEVFQNYAPSKPKRPRCVILVPTRELAIQIKTVCKSLTHTVKLSSQALVGGSNYGMERKQLNRPLDVLIATPGRLLKHWKDQNVYLGSTQYVVLDEMDTMLEQGFQQDLKEVLYPLLYGSTTPISQDSPKVQDGAPSVILTSATMTQSVQKVINPTNFKLEKVRAKKHYTKHENNNNNIVLPPLRVITAPGLHRAVPRLQQVFVPVGNIDKLSLVVDVVSPGGGVGAGVRRAKLNQDSLCLVFCNTVSSCRAVQHALAEADLNSVSYHGELNSKVRSENLQQFKAAAVKILVATDLAARGLDVPQVDHVVMFDFPLNSLDYLHRAGRTARGVSQERKGNGRVTALVAKRDLVLAKAIETAVSRGEPLDGLSSRKSDYSNRNRGNSSSSSSSGRTRPQRGGGGRGKQSTGGGRGRRRRR